MHLQEWYDDDNEGDQRGARLITKTNVFKRLNAADYDQQQHKEVIQRKWVNIDEIYAATPAAITLRMLLTLAQLRNHSIYTSDIQSAFLNTPVQPRTTILVKPPPERVNKTTTDCGKSTSNSTDYATHHRNSNCICHQYSNNLVYGHYAQTNVFTTTTTLLLWSTWMTYY
eukprot:4409205-Amphidinium_carterae.1